jgi:hypothetical protein
MRVRVMLMLCWWWIGVLPSKHRGCERQLFHTAHKNPVRGVVAANATAVSTTNRATHPAAQGVRAAQRVCHNTPAPSPLPLSPLSFSPSRHTATSTPAMCPLPPWSTHLASAAVLDTLSCS